MSFPAHIAAVLDRYGILPETKAALYDMYVELGSDVLEVFADFAERFDSPAAIERGDLQPLRAAIIERHVRANHERWLSGAPTSSLYHPRISEGRASGLARPLGRFGDDNGGSELVREIESLVRSITGPDQPSPRGVLMLGRNAHFGGRAETISFDVVEEDLAGALAIALSEGRQHTMPGSVGETSGTLDAVNRAALIWEIQPNVLKPAGERNRSIAKFYRRHRNWHIVTLVAALRWLEQQNVAIYVLKGSALQATHEVNQYQPVTDTIVQLHDRTVATVCAGLGRALRPLDADDIVRVKEGIVMNSGLTRYVNEVGAGEAMMRIVAEERAPEEN